MFLLKKFLAKNSLGLGGLKAMTADSLTDPVVKKAVKYETNSAAT